MIETQVVRRRFGCFYFAVLPLTLPWYLGAPPWLRIVRSRRLTTNSHDPTGCQELGRAEILRTNTFLLGSRMNPRTNMQKQDLMKSFNFRSEVPDCRWPNCIHSCRQVCWNIQSSPSNSKLICITCIQTFSKLIFITCIQTFSPRAGLATGAKAALLASSRLAGKSSSCLTRWEIDNCPKCVLMKKFPGGQAQWAGSAVRARLLRRRAAATVRMRKQAFPTHAHWPESRS